MSRRPVITSRRVFGGFAILLALALVALVGYLLWNANAPKRAASAPRAGLQAELVITGPARGNKPLFDRPLGAAFGPDGSIYVTDSGNNRVVVFDPKGNFVREFGGRGVAKPAAGAEATWKPGLLNFPTGIDVDTDGTIYVADFYNDSISVFDPNGKFLRRFPDPQKPVGKGSSGQNGNGIAVTDVHVVGDRVFATDAYQVFEFTKGGELVAQFGKPGTGPSDLDHPNGVTADGAGTVYVADSNNNRVSAFDQSGKALWQVGSPIAKLDEKVDNPFNIPRGIELLDNGDVIIVDSLAQELVRLSPDGKVVARYGVRGVEPAQLNFPNSVDAIGERLLVADKENNRVQILRMVGR